MECLQLRSPPHPSFHYLISEQAKSLVALQELQNEVGALLEFRDLVIETFPNLRSKMAPSTPAVTRRDWEPGVRVRRKLAGSGGDSARTKPQPSVQDSGFSTETSCGKDAHSSASASRSRPLEDELWALLDVIQRKGVRLRDEAELLRGELDERQSETAEESFARQLSAGCGDCTDVVRLRCERDALLARAAQLEALATSSSPQAIHTPLGRLDSTLDTPARPPRVSSPDSRKFSAILQESNPVELKRQLLVSIVQNQVYSDQLNSAAKKRTQLMDKLNRVREENGDLKFQLEEKTIELEGARAQLRQIEGRRGAGDSLEGRKDAGDSFEGRKGSGNSFEGRKGDGDSLEGRKGAGDSLERRGHSSMRDMEPLHMPDDDEAKISETPRRKPSRIPRHTAAKGAAPRPPAPSPAPRPPSSSSVRSVRSTTSGRSRTSSRHEPSARKDKAAVAIRHAQDKNQEAHIEIGSETDRYRDSLNIDSAKLEAGAKLVVEYLARTDRLFPRLHTVRTRPLPENLLQDCRLAYRTPQNLALELSKSILYENADSIDLKTLKSLSSHGDASLWDGKPQQYFESMNYAATADEGNFNAKEFDDDSLGS